MEVWPLPILQKTDPNMIAEATDMRALTLFVGPSRKAYIYSTISIHFRLKRNIKNTIQDLGTSLMFVVHLLSLIYTHLSPYEITLG